MGQIEVFSPAKINLFLSVVGRMDSGYHELVSLVALLDFGDRLWLETSEGPRSVELEVDDPSLPRGPENLAWRAALGFLNHYHLDLRVRIRLAKRIPAGAGLGGGSSNAAAVLEGLAQLLNQGEDRDVLEGLAAGLGSDCPLFLRRQAVVLRGRGERLETLGATERARLSGQRVLVLKPSFSINTPWAYQTLAKDPAGYEDRDWAEARLEAWRCGELPLPELLHNRFEPLAWAKYPALKLLRQRLVEAGVPGLMSGSGSACFFLLEDGARESELRDIIRERWGKHAVVESAKLL